MNDCLQFDAQFDLLMSVSEELDQIVTKNEESTEKLNRLKSGVEALLKKRMSSKVSMANKYAEISGKSSSLFQKAFQQKSSSPFDYNISQSNSSGGSNLINYLNHNNNSRPVFYSKQHQQPTSNYFKNESGLSSNFSSVANINHLLNHQYSHLKEDMGESGLRGTPHKEPHSSNLVNQIDELINRNKKTLAMPNDAFEKHFDKKQHSIDADTHPWEDKSSRFKNNQSSSFDFLQSLKAPIKQNKLETIEEDQLHEAKNTIHASAKPTTITKPVSHMKLPPRVSEVISNSSEYLTTQRNSDGQATHRYSNNNSDLPPLGKSRNSSGSSTEMHKALLRESLSEKKRMESEMSELNEGDSVNFELSDEEEGAVAQPSENNTFKQKERERLLKQKDQLEEELKEVQRELKLLQS